MYQKPDLVFIRESTIGKDQSSNQFSDELFMKKVNGEKVIGNLSTDAENLFQRLTDEKRQQIKDLNKANSQLKRTSTHFKLMEKKKLDSWRRESLTARVMFNEEVIDTRGRFVQEQA